MTQTRTTSPAVMSRRLRADGLRASTVRTDTGMTIAAGFAAQAVLESLLAQGYNARRDAALAGVVYVETAAA